MSNKTLLNELNNLFPEGSQATEIIAFEGYNKTIWSGQYYGYYNGTVGIYNFRVDYLVGTVEITKNKKTTPEL